MAYSIPTLEELYQNNKSRLEGVLGQTSPTNDKSFIKVLAKTEAAQGIGLYKYAADRARANLALTAVGEDLDNIGRDLNTPRRTAQSVILIATLPATTGTVISVTSDFIADANGLRYLPIEQVTAVSGVATLSLRCVVTGAVGNLDNGNELQIASQIAGASTTATVTSTDRVGVDKETDNVYRPRVLFAQRAITGGANATDYKIWAESPAGVRRAFPFAGRPASEGDTYPGDRTIFIEATTDIDPDGIAPAALLNAVRDAVNADPETGEARAPLGLTDDTLFTLSISRTNFYVEVRDFVVAIDREADCKNAVTTALTTYFDVIRPFVDGVDLVQERSDIITSLTIALVVQDVLRSFGATASSVGFGIVSGVFVSQYTLGQGELAKLATAGVTYT